MTTKDTKDTTTPAGPKADARNPSGATEEQLRAGENVGKVRGPDIDTSHHKYEFTDRTRVSRSRRIRSSTTSPSGSTRTAR